jgi:hypothetical protein
MQPRKNADITEDEGHLNSFPRLSVFSVARFVIVRAVAGHDDWRAFPPREKSLHSREEQAEPIRIRPAIAGTGG